MPASPSKITASFRDPGGFLFQIDGFLYRQVNLVCKADYDRLMASGLYADLTGGRQLIPHREVGVPSPEPDKAYKILRPEPIRFISYPYEWSFSQLKDAALLTLAIQKKALAYEMILKDASAYNIQFHRGSPILIDTLSFTCYREGEAWIAYRQFCQHFLVPLALIAYCDASLGKMLRIFIDGIPIQVASKLLPWRTRLSFSLLAHIHFHASAQRRLVGKNASKKARKRQMTRTNLVALIDSLTSAVRKLNWDSVRTEWVDYYRETNYSDQASRQKAEIVKTLLAKASPGTVWDLGANTGLYSRIASRQSIDTLAFDYDQGAVELNYLRCKVDGEAHLLPLIVDLSNPSPGLGWRNTERDSLKRRASADLVMALALIHHLAIGNNVPLPQLACFFSELADWLIVEFVPKSDSQVVRLLSTREDIFTEYHEAGFEAAMRQYFDIVAKESITQSERTLYLMKRLSK